MNQKSLVIFISVSINSSTLLISMDTPASRSRSGSTSAGVGATESVDRTSSPARLPPGIPTSRAIQLPLRLTQSTSGGFSPGSPGRSSLASPGRSSTAGIPLSPKLAPFSPKSGPSSPKSSARQDKELLTACREAQIERVFETLKKKPHLETTDELGYTPLFHAVLQGDIAITALLIREGASVNVIAADGNTPLLAAASNTPLAVLLLAQSANIDAQGPNGYTPLLAAINADNDELAYILLRREADVKKTTITGQTPLLLVFCKCYLTQRAKFADFIPLLITHGADAYAKDNELWFPLLWAAHNRSTAIARLLINLKACINDANNVGATPLFFAVYTDNLDLARDLLQAGAVHKIIAELPKACPDERVLCQDTSVSLTSPAFQKRYALYKQNLKWTPLLIAAYNGSTEIAELLVSHDKESLKDLLSNGMTALHLAILSKNPKVVKTLLCSELLNIRDCEGNTPLLLACKECCNAKKMQERPEGKILTMDIDTDFKEIIADLLACKEIEVNKADSNDYTPLYIAVGSRTKNLIEMLILTGADPDLVSNNGLSARHLAAELKEIKDLFSAKPQK